MILLFVRGFFKKKCKSFVIFCNFSSWHTAQRSVTLIQACSESLTCSFFHVKRDLLLQSDSVPCAIYSLLENVLREKRASGKCLHL